MSSDNRKRPQVDTAIDDPTTSPETLDVIAVGAHPDDVEIACGGTLALLAEQGYRVGIIDLTDGEPTPLCPNVETRMAEARAAAKALGVQRRIMLDLPNRRLFDSWEARVALATEFRRFRPSLVIGFGDKTPTASPDHWQAMQITDAAVFYSRLTKWDDQFEGTSPHTIAHHCYFHLSRDLTGSLNAVQGLTVDISSVLEKKMKAVACYQTQFPPEKRHVIDRVELAAKTLGNMIGTGAGELIIPVRPLATRNLMQALSLGDAQGQPVVETVDEVLEAPRDRPS